MSAIVVHHGSGCSDGFGSSWVAHKFLPDATFIATNYGEHPPDVKGKDVYVLDFCYPRQTILNMGWEAESLTILDHHKTAIDNLGFESKPDVQGGQVVFAGTDILVSRVREMTIGDWDNSVAAQLNAEQLEIGGYSVFDLNRSGVGLTWDHFSNNAPRPWLVNYVEAADLWRFESLDRAREVSCAIRSYPQTFEAWDELERMDVEELKKEGASILRAQQQQVSRIAKNAYEIEMVGHKVLVCNSASYASELGNYLSIGRPFAVVWFEDSNGDEVLSFRSKKGGVDVSEIAKRYGGGGHLGSAGARILAGDRWYEWNTKRDRK